MDTAPLPLDSAGDAGSIKSVARLPQGNPIRHSHRKRHSFNRDSRRRPKGRLTGCVWFPVRNRQAYQPLTGSPARAGCSSVRAGRSRTHCAAVKCANRNPTHPARVGVVMKLRGRMRGSSGVRRVDQQGRSAEPTPHGQGPLREPVKSRVTSRKQTVTVHLSRPLANQEDPHRRFIPAKYLAYPSAPAAHPASSVAPKIRPIQQTHRSRPQDLSSCSAVSVHEGGEQRALIRRGPVEGEVSCGAVGAPFKAGTLTLPDFPRVPAALHLRETTRLRVCLRSCNGRAAARRKSQWKH